MSVIHCRQGMVGLPEGRVMVIVGSCLLGELEGFILRSTLVRGDILGGFLPLKWLFRKWGSGVSVQPV
jgi:hypothetical protein